MKFFCAIESARQRTTQPTCRNAQIAEQSYREQKVMMCHTYTEAHAVPQTCWPMWENGRAKWRCLLLRSYHERATYIPLLRLLCSIEVSRFCELLYFHHPIVCLMMMMMNVASRHSRTCDTIDQFLCLHPEISYSSSQHDDNDNHGSRNRLSPSHSLSSPNHAFPSLFEIHSFDCSFSKLTVSQVCASIVARARYTTYAHTFIAARNFEMRKWNPE